MKNKFDFDWWANFANFFFKRFRIWQYAFYVFVAFDTLFYWKKCLFHWGDQKFSALYIPTDSTDRVLSHAVRGSICWLITHQNHCISARIPSDGVFPLLACETSSGNCSIYKSTRERVHSNGLYGRWRLHMRWRLLISAYKECCRA